ncbi:MAG: hypothetical protein R2848_18180 [Thermomicrobiales bacterium]
MARARLDRSEVNAGHPVESNCANEELPETLAQAAASDEVTDYRRGLGDLWPALAALAVGVLVFEWLWLSAGGGVRRGNRSLRGARA